MFVLLKKQKVGEKRVKKQPSIAEGVERRREPLSFSASDLIELKAIKSCEVVPVT